MSSGFWRAAAELEESGTPFVVITLVSGRGHVPQDPGAKALVSEEGLQFGTVGGGKVEAKAIALGRALLAERAQLPQIHSWNLQKDIGMTCGGEVTLLFEPKGAKPWNIVVYGAGHVGQALVRLLVQLECRVTCIDPRPEWLSKIPPAPRLRLIQRDEPASLVGEQPPDAFHVVVTKGHGTDMPVLEAIHRLQPSSPYVGAIGSETKASRIRSDLRALGCDASFIERLCCPIGLDLGTNHPAEIAISIVGQLIQFRDRPTANSIDSAGRRK